MFSSEAIYKSSTFICLLKVKGVGRGSDKLFVLREWGKGKWPVAKLHLESVGKVHTACAVFMLQ